MSITLQELITACTRPNAKELYHKLVSSNDGRGIFHDFMEHSQSDELREKMTFLFDKVQDLDIDINQVWYSADHKFARFAKWGNTPLHNGLAYENFQVIEWFFDQAQKRGLEINLQAQDAFGKTPLLLSIKVLAPIDLINKLVTDENYQMADEDGMTPMMLACALRRIDVMKLLIERDAKVKGYGPIDFSAIADEQKMQMSDFINQIHALSGKSLGHFAVLRAGTVADQKGDNLPKADEKKIRLAKQGCVLNLLKEAGMDGFRDEHARWNCVTNELREPSSIDSPLMKGGQLCFVSDHAHRDDSGRVYVNTKANIDKCLDEYGDILKIQVPKFFAYLKSQQFSGISLVETVMSRSENALMLLKTCGLNLEIQQHAGAKTVSGFIDGLKQNVASKNLISELDVKYLFCLPQELLSSGAWYASAQGFGFFNHGAKEASIAASSHLAS